MGDRSYLECTWFPSDLTRNQLNDLYKLYLDNMPEGKDTWCWEFEEDDGEYRPEGTDTWQKNYDVEELAIFIAMVTNEYVVMRIAPSEGEPWGYIINPGQVNMMEVSAGNLIYSQPRVSGQMDNEIKELLERRERRHNGEQ